MTGPAIRVVLVFLDGVGIGPEDPDVNPFCRAEATWLRSVLGGVPTLAEPAPETHRGAAFPLNATLGVAGIPQSGTGQASLLTGRNGARLFGRHFGPWIPVALRPLLAQHNLLRRAVDLGLATVFANAYPEAWSTRGGRRRPAGPPLAAESAGLLTRDHRHLAAGEAVASEIVNAGWRSRLGFSDLPQPEPEEAGAVLAALSRNVRLTVFAHYSTDRAGHRGGMSGALEAIDRVDRFLSGLAAELDEDALVFVVSDHGNLEDVRSGHTRNPALGLLYGPGAEARRPRLRSIMDVPAAVLTWLGTSPDPSDDGGARP